MYLDMKMTIKLCKKNHSIIKGPVKYETVHIQSAKSDDLNPFAGFRPIIKFFSFLNIHLAGPQIRVRHLKLFFLTYGVGTQKNRLDETVLLSTKNKCLNWWMRK